MRGVDWRGLSLHIRPSTPDGKTGEVVGLGFKWERLT